MFCQTAGYAPTVVVALCKLNFASHQNETHFVSSPIRSMKKNQKKFFEKYFSSRRQKIGHIKICRKPLEFSHSYAPALRYRPLSPPQTQTQATPLHWMGKTHPKTHWVGGFLAIPTQKPTVWVGFAKTHPKPTGWVGLVLLPTFLPSLGWEWGRGNPPFFPRLGHHELYKPRYCTD